MEKNKMTAYTVVGPEVDQVHVPEQQIVRTLPAEDVILTVHTWSVHRGDVWIGQVQTGGRTFAPEPWLAIWFAQDGAAAAGTYPTRDEAVAAVVAGAVRARIEVAA